MTTHAPTELAAEDWAGEMGERWLRHLERLEGMIATVGRALMEHAAHRPGERVIDVGCGGGATSIDIARRVGNGGSVLGVDISPALIGAAQRRARDAGVTNVAFRCADAATFAAGAPFDRLFSRFGLMFFPHAQSAFANLHRLLRPRGRADFSVWAPARENAWIAQMMQILARHVELPRPEPRSPGPFALDDPNYVRELLAGAGFRSSDIVPWQGDQLVGGPGATPAAAADLLFEAMSLGRQLQHAGSAVQQQVRAELIELFSRHRSPEGIRMSASAFLVSAEAGG